MIQVMSRNPVSLGFLICKMETAILLSRAAVRTREYTSEARPRGCAQEWPFHLPWSCPWLVLSTPAQEALTEPLSAPVMGQAQDDRHKTVTALVERTAWPALLQGRDQPLLRGRHRAQAWSSCQFQARLDFGSAE